MDELSEAHEDLLSRKSLRSALKRWDRSQHLGEHPLTRLQIVRNRRLIAGYRETTIGFGLALREVLQDAIDELKPDRGEPDYLKKRWRPFLILSEQFIQGRSPDYVCEQLGIARSTYNHEQAQALEMLTDILGQREHIFTTQGIAADGAIVDSTKVVKTPFLAPPRPHYAIVGREELLQDLKDQMLHTKGLNVAAIYGLPGVGKTTLAIALANDPQVMNHFEDGVLWAGLGRHPDIMALLSFWGEALGVAMGEIAKLLVLEERARAIHAAIGTRRMLLVIDDVWEASEGLAFKIGGPNCGYLLTTRLPRIAIDFAGEGARVVKELDLKDGMRLLSRFTPGVVDSAPEEARALVQEVGGLPLALVLMGKYLQREAHVGQVQRLRRAMDRLKLGEEWMQLTQSMSPIDQQPSLPIDMPLSLRTVITISDESLDDLSKQALRALSVFPPKPNSFNEEAALHVSQAPVETLDHLMDCGLIESRPPDRFTLHQTIAEYTRMELDDDHPRKAFVGFFVRYVENNHLDFKILDPETRNIFTALSNAEDLGMQVELVNCAIDIFPFVESKGLFDLAEEHLVKAAHAARDLKDEDGLLTLLIHLGNLSHRCGNYEQAEKYYLEGKDLGRGLADKNKLGEVFKGLGVVAFSRGRYEEAESWYREGLSLANSTRNTALQGALLANLGVLLVSLGEFDKADSHFQDALISARALGDNEMVSRLLINLGVMAGRRLEYSNAEEFFQESLELAHGAGRQDTMSFILTNLGTLANDQGHLEIAESYFQEGLALAREVSDRARESHLLANLGALANARQGFLQARDYLLEGLALARKIGHRENMCLLLTNLAVLSKDEGDFKQSEAYFQEALTLAKEMGHRRYMTAVLSNWGELHLLREAWDEAEDAFHRAQDIAEEIHLWELAALSLFGLARAKAAKGDKDEARCWGEESLQAYQKIKHPKAAQVERWLKEQ